jgi:hypothetical protein
MRRLLPALLLAASATCAQGTTRAGPEAAEDPSDAALPDEAGVSAEAIETTVEADLAPEVKPEPRMCHWDCFGGSAHCLNDKAIVIEGGAVYWPCDGPGSVTHCKEHSYDCAQGCEGPKNKKLDWTKCHPKLLCHEWQPKYAGDPCTTDADCGPVFGDCYGNVGAAPLACDVTATTCVPAPPPVIPDWLQPCGLEDPAAPTNSWLDFLPAPKCAHGLCLVAKRGNCVAQGCSRPCDHDGECPAGSLCYGAAVYNPAPAKHGPACVPLPTHEAMLAISCP